MAVQDATVLNVEKHVANKYSISNLIQYDSRLASIFMTTERITPHF